MHIRLKDGVHWPEVSEVPQSFWLVLPYVFSSFPCLSLQIPCVMVPIGQYTHHDLGRNNTIVISSSMVDVSIIPKNPNAN